MVVKCPVYYDIMLNNPSCGAYINWCWKYFVLYLDIMCK